MHWKFWSFISLGAICTALASILLGHGLYMAHLKCIDTLDVHQRFDGGVCTHEDIKRDAILSDRCRYFNEQAAITMSMCMTAEVKFFVEDHILRIIVNDVFDAWFWRVMVFALVCLVIPNVWMYTRNQALQQTQTLTLMETLALQQGRIASTPLVSFETTTQPLPLPIESKTV